MLNDIGSFHKPNIIGDKTDKAGRNATTFYPDIKIVNTESPIINNWRQ